MNVLADYDLQTALVILVEYAATKGLKLKGFQFQNMKI
jgi:hypothetical protein